MAMGKTEMECPVELWVVEENSPGHPDEHVLSMLQSIRSHLHPFIFRDQNIYPTLSSFFSEFLSRTNAPPEGLPEFLDVCSVLLQPVVELLSSSGDLAPERLMRMLLEESKGEWRIALGEEKEKGKGEGGRVLELELFYLARLKRGLVGKRLVVSEIEDFQSSVMLSRTEVREEEVQVAVMNFVESFAWCKILCEAMMEIEVFFFFSHFL